MNIREAIEKRNSVRSYLDKPIEQEKRELLQKRIEDLNKRGSLKINLVCDDPAAFKGFFASYGKMVNVKNYITIVGKKSDSLQKRAGYYGEDLVIYAQQLGLNTCWIALTFNKGKAKYELEKDEKLVCVIAIGYGETQGVAHKDKPLNELYTSYGNTPSWFLEGVKSAQRAPTAMNQQKFHFTLVGNTVKADTKRSPYTMLDLGIAMYHFEVGAGISNFKWVE